MIDKATRSAMNRLAFPAILSGLAEPVISLVDTAIVGTLDASAIAAVGLGSSSYMALVWMFSSIGGAVASMVAQKVGEGADLEARKLIPQGLMVGLLIGMVLMVFSRFFIEDIFHLYQAKGEVFYDSTIYFGIRSYGFPFTLCTAIIIGIFKGYQNTIWAMYMAFAGGAINLVLDLTLVLGIEGWVPSFGVAGAAYASLIAQLIMFLMGMTLLVKRLPFPLKIGNWDREKLKLLRMSGDMVIRTFALSGTLFLANRGATELGKVSIAAHTIIMNIWLFSAFFIDGYAHAGMAMIGKASGAGDKKQVFLLGQAVVKIGLWISLALSAVYLAMYFFTAEIFTDDAEVILLFNAVYWLCILSQPVNAIAFIFDGVYIGLGKIDSLRNNLITATLLGFLPVYLLSQYFDWHLTGIWMALTAWMLIRSFPLWWQFHRGYSGV